MAHIAMVNSVHDVAAEADQPRILALQVQRHRRDLKAGANPHLVAVIHVRQRLRPKAPGAARRNGFGIRLPEVNAARCA